MYSRVANECELILDWLEIQHGKNELNSMLQTFLEHWHCEKNHYDTYIDIDTRFIHFYSFITIIYYLYNIEIFTIFCG